jgi:type V secretory pathway adhesin AidA
MFGEAGESSANVVKLDVFSDNNTSTDNVVVTDDSGETTRYTSSSRCGTSPRCYKGRYTYDGSHSDGAVLGPYTGTDFRIFIDIGGTSTINSSDTLTLKGKDPGLDSFEFFSKAGYTFPLGDVDNFTVGYNTSIDCSN